MILTITISIGKSYMSASTNFMLLYHQHVIHMYMNNKIH